MEFPVCWSGLCAISSVFHGLGGLDEVANGLPVAPIYAVIRSHPCPEVM